LLTTVDDGENQMDPDQLKDNFRHQAKQASTPEARSAGDTDVLDLLGLSAPSVLPIGSPAKPPLSLRLVPSGQSVASSRMSEQDLQGESSHHELQHMLCQL
jgi:hypothetical protein